MPYQEQNALFRQRTSTFAQATTENPILLPGEKWWEVDAANLTTGRSKTGKDGRVVNDVIVGTAFNDLPFDPTGTGEGGPGDPTNLSITNRTATGLDIASSTGNDATVPLATETLAGLLAPAAKAKVDGIASGATANATNEQLRDRSTHTGTQPASTITGLGTAATANTGDFATSAQGALAATAVQPPGLASTLAAYLTAANAASSYQPLSANLTALAANNAAYYLARSNHSGTQALSTISGLGTGIANALAVNAGAAGAPVLFDGAGGTPSSLGLLNATGLPLATGVSGLLSIANGGTGTSTPGLVAGTHVTITGTWPNQTINATGGGTVTSVGLSLPALFTITGSPVTTSGTLTATLAAQSANLVWAGPATGTPAAPAFRSLVANDIPTIPAGQVSGIATVATSGGTGDLTETGGNQFFTAARAIASTLAGFTAGAGTVSDSDSILQALQKLAGNIANRALTGLIGSSGLTMATGRLAGRSTAGTGAVEEIIIGTGLSFDGNTLNATGGAPAASLFVYDATSTANTIFTAQAPVGTAESATGWTIKRTTFSALGVKLTGPLTAVGAWIDRTSLTYS